MCGASATVAVDGSVAMGNGEQQKREKSCDFYSKFRRIGLDQLDIQ